MNGSTAVFSQPSSASTDETSASSAAVSKEAPKTLVLPGPLLEVRGVTKHYRSQSRVTRAFEGLSFAVQPSEIVVLLGASGCGKSSLLKTIAGLERADQGGIYIEGTELRAPSPAIGLVFQQPTLLPWLDVAQNIAFGLRLAHSPQFPAETISQRVQHALSDVGLGGVGKARPSELSGGMAQRVALARALVREPKLLLLDEPFGALDAITRLEMQRVLLRLISAHQTAAVLVTHDLDEALLLGDRILLMAPHPGRIIAEWALPKAQPRFENTLELAPLRAEILGALSRTFQS